MVVKVIGAFIAIAAFAVLLETPKHYLKYAGVVGAIGWFVFLLSEKMGTSEVFATFLSAMAIAIVSHIFARLFKAPVTVFLIAGIQLFCMGIQGQYLAKTYLETKRRPIYIVKESNLN